MATVTENPITIDSNFVLFAVSVLLNVTKAIIISVKSTMHIDTPII